MEDMFNSMAALMSSADIPINDVTVAAVLQIGGYFAGFLLGVIIAGWLIGIFVITILELIVDLAYTHIMYRKYPSLKVVRFYQRLLRREHKVWTNQLYLEADGTARLITRNKTLPIAADMALTLQRPVEVEQDYRGRHVIVVGPAAA